MRIIAGELGGRTIRTVSGPGYRPATSKVRQAVFSALESRGVVWEGARVLDLFAGSGSLGLEALSRGAAEAWFVESNRRAADVLRQNVMTLGLAERCRVLPRDLFAVIGSRAAHPFDVVFIDPPYGKNLLAPAMKKVLENGWVKEQGVLVAETEKTLDGETGGWAGLQLLVQKSYGQTRIHIWRHSTARERSTREHSTR
jgi:16S rRNA (guanine966-N2)-methyltransferase